jgi:hypothetical protein
VKNENCAQETDTVSPAYFHLVHNTLHVNTQIEFANTLTGDWETWSCLTHFERGCTDGLPCKSPPCGFTTVALSHILHALYMTWEGDTLWLMTPCIESESLSPRILLPPPHFAVLQNWICYKASLIVALRLPLEMTLVLKIKPRVTKIWISSPLSIYITKTRWGVSAWW